MRRLFDFFFQPWDEAKPVVVLFVVMLSLGVIFAVLARPS